MARGKETEEEFPLFTDWCKKGYGYIIFDRNPHLGRIIPINYKKIKDENLNRYLGEWRVLVWSLKDIRGMVMGSRVCLHTNFGSVF